MDSILQLIQRYNVDKNIFIEDKSSRELFQIGNLFMILAHIGVKEHKERSRYIGGILLWKAKVFKRNEKRRSKRRKRSNMGSINECQILQFPSIKEIA